MLQESRVPLWQRFDLAILDLDGVVYIGPDAVDGAARNLDRAVAHGMRHAFVTNNASRTPGTVAAHLRELGIHAKEEDVVTSAQAAARLVAGVVPAGSKVLVMGGEGLEQALAEHDLVSVKTLADEPIAVVSGYHPDLRWKTVMQGAIGVRDGLPWIASNTDMTAPTPQGLGPGSGVLVEAVARYSGRRPTVAGKPEVPLFEETVRRVGGKRPLVVGDRLDTDIEGAHNAGLDSLLVLTGVTGLDDLVAAQPRLRPSYLSATLAGLGTTHPVPERVGQWSHRCGGWETRVGPDGLAVTGSGSTDDWWRVVAATGWDHLDTTGNAVVTSGLVSPGSVGAAAEQADGRAGSQE